MAVGLFLLGVGPGYLSAHNDDDHNSAYTQGERYGYDRGYEHGRADKANGKDFNFRHASDYKRGDVGWNRDMGKKKDYVNGFRAGYEAGYNDGYYDRRGRRAGEAPYGRYEGPDRDRGRGGRGFGRWGDDDRDRYGRGVQGRRFQEPQFVWRGRVDGKDYIKLSGDRVWIDHSKFKPITEDTFDLRSPLPRESVNVLLKKLRGRDRVEIVEQPGPQNNYTVTVLIEDRPAHSDFYEFELYW
jgi:hypothetical protein